MKHLFVPLLSLALLGNTLKAQNNTATKPFVMGVVDEIQSAQLGESRTLNIYLPEGYDKDSQARYPVIYLLDGSADEDFLHITGLVQFFNMIKAMPKSIVVGIANIDRKRDFTFPTTVAKDKKDFPTTGSSAKFISFLEKDLQPYIQGKYRTNASKIIIGQSLGGLLATEVLLKKPDLFNNYVIISPSLWWDNESLLSKATELSKPLSSKDIKVYVSVGTEGKIMEDDAKNLAEVLKKAASKSFKVHFCPLPNENHLTILHQSVYKAFEVLNPKK